jgi:propanol-preferring alcohol dehydrogenase
MKAWQLTAAKEPLRRIERDDPRPGPGQVVVDVRAAGICHSDVGFIDGTLTPMLAKLPLVLGHEVAGVVTEVGPNVTGLQVGDRVAAFGDEQHAPGWSIDGGFADKFLAQASGLVKLPDAVDFVQAATATDAGQTAHGAVIGAGKLRPGERIGIIGLGGLGLTGAQIAALAGAHVYAADPKHDTWGLAKQCGVLETVEHATDLAAFNLDMIVDFAGFGTTTANAIIAVRPGGRVIQVGLGRSEATISTAALVGKAVTLRGARGGRIRDFEAVIDRIAKGDLSIQTMTTSFEQIPEAIERLKDGDVLRRIVALIG